MRTTTLILTASVIALSGCSTLSSTRAQDFKLDDVPLQPAMIQTVETDTIEGDSQPQTIILEQFTAVPLPGQLKPREISLAAVPTHGKPHAIIDAAQASAKVGPKPGAYVNAIQVYPFARGALYQVYTAPEQVTDIALQPGEALISVSSGDTERWILGDTLSGSGETEQVHILVKPVESGLSTNLVITTTKRTYHAELTSYRKSYMAAVSWRYPREDLIQLSKMRTQSTRSTSPSAPKARETVAAAPAGLSIDQLNFRYRIEGDDPYWRPLQAFDDGQKIYIQFPARLDQGEAPPLFVVGGTGDTQLVNYRVKGRYYVVDRLFARAELRLGEKDQQIVRIERVAS